MDPAAHDPAASEGTAPGAAHGTSARSADSPPEPERGGTPLRVIFLTLFLDLVGFSIIFPLFPAILEHYADDPTLIALVDGLRRSFAIESPSDPRVQVLFGGVLGSLYSLLQFFASPLWGRISDRIGRRPVLLVTVAGIGLSYLLWGLAGSFTLLVVSRLLAGAMGGNISAATAAVSDITTRRDRAKGMGVIGAAFGLGFVLGPAIGTALVQIDLTRLLPGLVPWGLNPFSACAFGAGLLSALNWIWIRRRFEETLPPSRRNREMARSPLPVLSIGRRFGGAVARGNLVNLLLLIAFSGMEFTLSFVARDRFDWGPAQIGGLFVHIGLVLALVQGGIVRRIAPRLGERRVSLAGLVTIALGLAGIALDAGLASFWLSVTALSIGGGLTFPTLSSLVSLHAGESVQGEVLGIFRALGSLARVIGPLVAAVLYWREGPALPYWSACAFLVVPILILISIPPPPIDTALAATGDDSPRPEGASR